MIKISSFLFLGGLNINFQKKLVQPLIISFVVICIVAGLETIDIYRIFGTYGERFATVITLLIFPVTPIIYGWIIKDKIGAIIVGTVPIFILLFFGNLFGMKVPLISHSGPSFKVFDYIGHQHHILVLLNWSQGPECELEDSLCSHTVSFLFLYNSEDFTNY
ncbi:hypothetical protein [Methanosarcina siciliae]|uniref:hypothetical protein n=1 Tax=Methanosarcina siciliae TaxID=38027 RepID=UPI001E5B5958|nr:hypothetical protein [Methanosarcina siciliae]